jgi:hypothetical protein
MDGSFSLSVDAASGTARLADVDLKLIGNEAVQQTALDPLVTPAGVAGWLEDREFEDLQVLGPFTVYADSTYPDLVVTDFLNGVVTLAGGFDHTPVDGIGVRFDANARVVPEPHSVILLVIGLALAFMVCDQRSQKARQAQCRSGQSC